MPRTCGQHRVAKCEPCQKARFVRYARKDKSISEAMAAILTRVCVDCKQEKVLTQFFKNRHASKGYRYDCKACGMKRDKTSPTRAIRARKSNLKRTFGVGLAEWNAMLLRQNNACAICKTPQSEFDISLAVDHDHVTGENRGLLCSNCNNGIGRFADRVEVLRNAIAYLEEYNLSKSPRQLPS